MSEVEKLLQAKSGSMMNVTNCVSDDLQIDLAR